MAVLGQTTIAPRLIQAAQIVLDLAPPPLSWNLEIVPLPWADEDGQPLNSCVLIPNDSLPAAQPVKEKMGNQQRPALKLLEELFQRQRENLESSGHDPNTARVSMKDWEESMKSLDADSGNRTQIRQSLQDSGHVIVENGFVRLASR